MFQFSHNCLSHFISYQHWSFQVLCTQYITQKVKTCIATSLYVSSNSCRTWNIRSSRVENHRDGRSAEAQWRKVQGTGLVQSRERHWADNSLLMSKRRYQENKTGPLLCTAWGETALNWDRLRGLTKPNQSPKWPGLSWCCPFFKQMVGQDRFQRKFNYAQFI